MKIKVLLVAPGIEVQKIKIPASTKFIKSLIGDKLLKIRVSNKIGIIANKYPNIEEFNRLYKDRTIKGSFLVVGLKNDRLASLKKRDMKRYYNLFKISKHKKRIEQMKDEYLEEYYAKQINLKLEANKENKQKIFGIAA